MLLWAESVSDYFDRKEWHICSGDEVLQIVPVIGKITKVTISAPYEVTAGRLSTLIALVDNLVVGFTQLLIILADIRLHRIEFDSFNQLRIFVLDPRPYHCSPKSR